MLKEYVSKSYGKELKDCTEREIYLALLQMSKELAKEKESNAGKKKVYYISAEFLTNRNCSQYYLS